MINDRQDRNPEDGPTPSPHPPLMINRVRYRGEVSDIVTSSYPPDSWHPSSRVNSLLSPPSPASPVWIMSAEIWLRYVHISSRLIRRQWATWPGRSPGPPSWGVGSVDWFYLLERIGSIFGVLFCTAPEEHILTVIPVKGDQRPDNNTGIDFFFPSLWSLLNYRERDLAGNTEIFDKEEIVYPGNLQMQ